MPAKNTKNPKLAIRLDLLKPQSSPEKMPVKLLRWLLSTGRYIFIFVEGLVLIAFLTRFKLDADLEQNKETIEGQIPFIESLKPYEILIRQTQLKLSTIESVRNSSPNFGQILKAISGQTPQGVKLSSINMEGRVGKVTIQMNGQAQTNIDLSSFLAGLKNESIFTNVNLASIGMEQNLLRFTISFNTQAGGGSSL